MPARGVAFHPLDPRSALARFLLGVVFGVVAWFVTPASVALVPRALIAVDVGGVVMLAVALAIIARASIDETRRRAAAEDPGRLVVWVLVLGVSALSLFTAIFVLRHAHASRDERLLQLVLGVATAAIAWLLTQTAFTLRYAHLYYRAGEADEGGIEFPGNEPPDDLDFAYFAFTIGMCFQVSDVQVTSRMFRRTVMAHAMLSFAYNTGILALVINVVLSQLG